MSEKYLNLSVTAPNVNRRKISATQFLSNSELAHFLVGSAEMEEKDEVQKERKEKRRKERRKKGGEKEERNEQKKKQITKAGKRIKSNKRN
jgi:hypothetical protein